MTKEQIEILKFYETVTAETGEDDLNSVINAVLAETEERKTGKWEVKLMRHFAHLLICSNCGADINITAEEHLEYYKRNFRYCPYCGAKMKEG